MSDPLDFEIQHYPDYRATLKQCVQDRFLGGRGTAWARYEPHIRAQSLQQPVDGTQVSEDEAEPTLKCWKDWDIPETYQYSTIKQHIFRDYILHVQRFLQKPFEFQELLS